AKSPTVQFAGTTLAEGVSESVTEALQIAIEMGLLDEKVTLGKALNQIARAGVIGTGIGAPLGTIPAGQQALENRRERRRKEIEGELRRIEEESISDEALDREIQELERE